MLNGIKVVIILAIALLVGYPFFKDEVAEEAATDQTILKNQLSSKRDHVYAAIKELEFDYNMGKLSEEDFNTLKRKYRHEAITILKQLDELSDSKE